MTHSAAHRYSDQPWIRLLAICASLGLGLVLGSCVALTQSTLPAPASTALNHTASTSEGNIAPTPQPSPNAEATPSTTESPSLAPPADLAIGAPSFIKQQISVPVGGGGGSEPFWLEPGAAPPQPTVLKKYTSIRRRSLAPNGGVLTACGYRENEAVTVTLRSPTGDIVSETYDRAVAVSDSTGASIVSYCCREAVPGDYAFSPGAAYGEYVIELVSSQAKITYPFTLVPPYKPELYRTSPPNNGNYVLVGFDPGEQVMLLIYEFAGAARGEMVIHNLVGSPLLAADHDGMAVIAIPGNSTGRGIVEIAALGNKGHYITYGRWDAPVEPSAMLAVQPNNPVAWRLSALYSRRDDRAGAFSDLTRAIELAPNNAELYIARAEMAPTKEDALRDLSQAITLKPDHADAYLKRGRVWAERADPDGIERARADYQQALDLSTTAGGDYEAKRLLAELPK